ncbi:hypothetical protein [Streptomyces sp. NBC_01361]|uniref:hypothetical protein n=1 Tax=Streptomyces sp. NBC_01361 TaxID=2903838 RepID=UPI002E33F393|nr:hypothetical protein [Streptomyces sp. NBC_01361]
MPFTDLTQLASCPAADELRSDEAMWEHAPGGSGYVPLCNLVRGCGAPAEWVIEHPATSTRRYVCKGFHSVEVVADAVAHWVAGAIEVAEYLASQRN